MFIRSLFWLGLLLVLPIPTHAQQAMEMYIPIGASVGVSKTASVIGKIESVDAQHRTLTVNDGAGTFTVSLPDKTPIWLDRSKSAGVNQIGSAGDLKTGLNVEVKYLETTRGPRLTADWIKIEMPR